MHELNAHLQELGVDLPERAAYPAPAGRVPRLERPYRARLPVPEDAKHSEGGVAGLPVSEKRSQLPSTPGGTVALVATFLLVMGLVVCTCVTVGCLWRRRRHDTHACAAATKADIESGAQPADKSHKAPPVAAPSSRVGPVPVSAGVSSHSGPASNPSSFNQILCCTIV